jgi:hypothetical protein
MSVVQEHLINNDPPQRLRTKVDQIRVVEKIPAHRSSHPREDGLSFGNDFTCEHSLRGSQFDFIEISGIF